LVSCSHLEWADVFGASLFGAYDYLLKREYVTISAGWRLLGVVGPREVVPVERDIERKLADFAGESQISIHARPSTSIPRYHQLSRILQKFLCQVDLQEGDRFPSEGAIATCFGVSRPTANKAVQELVKQGWLLREPGRGSFVRHPPCRILTFLSHNLRLSDSQSPEAQLVVSSIRTEEQCADKEIADVLAIEPGDPIIYIRRLFTVNDLPAFVVDSWLSAKQFPGIGDEPLLEDSVFTTLKQKYHCDIHYSEWSVDAHEVLDAELAAMLGITLFSPVLFVIGIRFTKQEEPIGRFCMHINQGISVKNIVYHDS